MFAWFERLFAPPARKPAHPKEAAARPRLTPPEELMALFGDLKRTGSTDWSRAAAALSALDARELASPVLSARILAVLEELMLPATGSVKQTLGLAQVALKRLPEMKAALKASRPVSGVPGLELLEGLLEMRAGRFDRALPHLAAANRLERVVEAGRSAADPLAVALSLAASTLGALENPDLKFWGDVLEAVPIDEEAYLQPDAVLVSAGELILEVHRAAAASLTCRPEERSRILALAGSRATMLTAVVHPDAERARAVVGRIERMLTGGFN